MRNHRLTHPARGNARKLWGKKIFNYLCDYLYDLLFDVLSGQNRWQERRRFLPSLLGSNVSKDPAELFRWGTLTDK